MYFKRFLAILVLAKSFIVFFSGVLYAQTVSNEGSNFWVAFPTHAPSELDDLAELVLFITSKSASSGVVKIGNNVIPFSVNVPNTVTPVPVPRGLAYIEGAGLYSGKGVNVIVDVGKPKVVVYAHIFAGRRSAASLVLPVEALGQQYYAMSYTQTPTSQELENITFQLRSQFTIIATEPNTTVLIHPRINNVPVGGAPIQVTLTNAGDVYEYTSSQDVTGTYIEIDPATSACKRFAVFSGSSATSVVCSRSQDPLFQQVYPISSWGKEYGYIPFSGPDRGNMIRVVASEDNTQATVAGVTVNLNKGEFYTTPAPVTTPHIITSDKAIAVAQYALSQACADTRNLNWPSVIDHPVKSDPDMVILNPVEFNIRDITVYSSKEEDISSQFINILIKTSGANSFRVNGNVPSGAGFMPIGSTGYSYLQLNVAALSENGIRLSASEGFNAIAYGFGDTESYAYSAGTNLAANQGISAVRKITREELSSACTEEEYDYMLVLQEEAKSLFWKFDANDPGINQSEAELNPEIEQKDGKTLYKYFYPRSYIFNSAGQKSIKVIVEYKNPNICNSLTDEIDFLFEVYDPPAALFDAPAQACAGAVIRFTDKSSAVFKPVSKWQWDFGDGSTSDLQNPSHTYNSPGEYTVRLSASNETACAADVSEQKIVVKSIAAAAFSATDGECSSNTISFTDASTIADGQIVKWIWDFGDQTIIERTANSPVTHTYQAIGSYNVKLTVVNDLGCESVPLVKQVNVFAPTLKTGGPVFLIEGESSVLQAAATGNDLQYKWTPGLGLNRDDIQNPVATPADDIVYTLTVTSREGCVLSDAITVKVLAAIKAPNTFTPNGDNINDVWNIENVKEYPGAVISIFNRYGVKIYASVGYDHPWDGKHKGEDVPAGTYYYVIDYKMERKAISGSVSVIR